MKGKRGSSDGISRQAQDRRVAWIDREVHEAVGRYAEERGGIRLQNAYDELLKLALRSVRVPVIGWVGDTSTKEE